MGRNLIRNVQEIVKELYKNCNLPFQIEEKGFGYDFKQEMDKYGPFSQPLGRDSDDPDSDLEERDRQLQDLAKDRQRKSLKGYYGRGFWLKHRSIAKFEARLRDDWDEKKFDNTYPKWEFKFADSDEYPSSEEVSTY